MGTCRISLAAQGSGALARAVLVLSLVAAVLSVGVRATTSQAPVPPAPQQPVAYSHKLHAGTLKLPCAGCHQNADPGERMGIPGAETCMQCHQTMATDRPEVQKLAALARTGSPIPWARVYQIPDYVLFSHRAHLQAGSTCADCHGQVAELERMARIGDVSMAGCVNCHSAKGASTDCSYCHQPFGE